MRSPKESAPLMDRRSALCAAGLLGVAMVTAGRPAAARSPALRVLPAQSRWGPPPEPAPVRQGLAPLPGVRLWYWDTGGAGEPVILIHPGTGSHAIWGYQQPVLAKAGYRVIGYSRRGHLQSETGPADDPGYASDDLRALMDVLGIARAHLVGSAAGGFIVPDFALSYPERLLSITIASSLGGAQDPAYRAASQALLPPGWLTLPESFHELGPAYRSGYPEGVTAWEALETRARFARVSPPIRHVLTWDALERITARSMVLTGGADLYQPPANMFRYAEHLVGSERVVIEQAGHSAYWEQPEAFNASLIDFFGRRP